ncbi:MAG: hypothetical protein OQL19_21845 [Gammaproteobacteria bacterium]|nr:hypothetical protein [Gammaproteobacteria bacterium]
MNTTTLNSSKANLKFTTILIVFILCSMIATLFWLLVIVKPTELKSLIEDDGPIQLFGYYSILLAFFISLGLVFIEPVRRSSYLCLSYLLLFYALREGDYHYRVSEYAKATQIKRFYSHEMIPISTKLFMACITLLFLYCFFKYLKNNKAIFFNALRAKLPWAIITLCWGIIFFLSQAIDQLPFFHNIVGQVFEEVFEAGAEVFALCALLLFRFQDKKLLWK